MWHCCCKSGCGWPYLVTTNQQQYSQTLFFSFFGSYLYAKNLRHCLFPSVVLMIKESCNLIGQEHISVMKFMQYMIKRHHFSLRIHLIFHSELVIMCLNDPQTNQIYPWLSLRVSGNVQACMAPLNQQQQFCMLSFLGYYFYAKNKDIGCSLAEILLIKKSRKLV